VTTAGRANVLQTKHTLNYS